MIKEVNEVNDLVSPNEGLEVMKASALNTFTVSVVIQLIYSIL